jgi:hypothetical protein
MIELELTLDEVAERLRMAPLTLRRFLRSIDFLAIRGGDTLLFTADDYVTIREARRQYRSNSSRRVVVKPRTTASAGSSPGAIDPATFTKLRELRTRNSPNSIADKRKIKPLPNSSQRRAPN